MERQQQQTPFLPAQNEADVLRIFRDYRGEIDSMLAIWGAADLVFPVEELDRHFEAHPQMGQRVAQLTILGFDPVNADRMLEFICARFPNVLNLHFMNLVEIEMHHLLTQLTRLPRLIVVQLAIFEEHLNAELLQRHRPFTRIRKLQLQSSYDQLDLFEAFIPRLFPNVKKLSVNCGTIQFKDQFRAKALALFPRLTNLDLAYPKLQNGVIVEVDELSFEF